MELRLKKQLIVVLIFFVIVGFSGFGLFKTLVPPKPSPTPDPTANLSPLKIGKAGLIPVDEDNFDYDFFANVINDNPNYGSSLFTYQVEFIDQNGVVIDTRNGKSYIMPGASRFVVESPLRFNSKIAQFRFKITDTKWDQLDPLIGENVQILLQTKPVFELRDVPGVFGVVAGLLRNLSQFNVSNVDISVALEDANGQILGVGKTSINTFIMGTTRGFETRWHRPISGDVSKVNIYTYTNLFNLENIDRTEGGGIDRFQEIQ